MKHNGVATTYIHSSPFQKSSLWGQIPFQVKYKKNEGYTYQNTYIYSEWGALRLFFDKRGTQGSTGLSICWFGPDCTGLDRTGPDQTGPDRTRLDQTGPDRTRPDRTGPDWTRPDLTGPD